jgi:arylsulfatase A-like enzyme
LGGRVVIEEQVGLADVFPTVLSVLGLEDARGIDGASLLDLTENPPTSETEAKPRKVYAETLFETVESDASRAEIKTCYSALRVLPWKLIWDRLENDYELYRVDMDPHETSNCAASNPETVAVLSAELHQLAQELPAEAESTDQLLRMRLEGLGYL